ncbi:MAG: ADP-ribosylglycohydrolase family protein [bacterium]|nr:ADP-ribosylglycohydrolase family protein [bacterium]
MTNMIGAIIGDICGSFYEFSNESNYDNIELFHYGSRFTDDTVCTCAIAKWLLDTHKDGEELTDEEVYNNLANNLKYFCQKHPNAGYGGMFHGWIFSNDSKPYGSYGNGSGMRVSPCGYFAKTIDEARELARISAMPTHNHEEGIKGAEAIASAIWMARSGGNKEQIKHYISIEFNYDLNRNVESIKGTHRFNATCQVTVPEAIIAFLDGNNFEECIKKAIEIGGDSDTIACMTGAIAGAYYGVPDYYANSAMELLSKDLKDVIVDFETNLINKNK